LAVSPDRSADLCWGQRYIWLRYNQVSPQARHDAHIVSRFPLPPGISVAMLRNTLNYLVRRHEALRTTYHSDADADPRQRVHPPGPVPLTQVSTEPDGSPTPAEVIGQLSTSDFDLAEEWPIRACVLTTGDVPKQLVLVLNHMAFDAWTVDRFERELESLGTGLVARRPTSLEPIRFQPLDLARYESSPANDAAKEQALAYWQAEIERMPGDSFALRRTPVTEPAARGASLTSPAMLPASRQIADRLQVWPSLVHLAVYASMMAAYTGSDRVGVHVFNGNRGSNDYTDVMTCAFSPLPIVADCAGNPSFSELLAQVAQRFEQGREHQLPYDELLEQLALEGTRRGQQLRTGAELNFLNHGAHSSRAKRTSFAWNPAPAAWAEFGSDSYFRIYELQDAVVIALNAMSTVMNSDAIQQLLRGYETVLLAHLEPGVDLRVDEVAALLGWSAPGARQAACQLASTSTGPVDTGRIATLLCEHPAVAQAAVSVQEAGLVADVLAEHPVTPARLRGYLLGFLDDDRPTRCPDLFRIRLAGARQSGADQSGAVVLGDGRGAAPAPARTEAEAALAAVTMQANGLVELDLADSYSAAGGRVLRIPRVLALLRDDGWVGLTVCELTSALPMRALAQRLQSALDGGAA